MPAKVFIDVESTVEASKDLSLTSMSYVLFAGNLFCNLVEAICTYVHRFAQEEALQSG